MTKHCLQPDHFAVIVGAGFGGIAAGVELRRAGVEDFILLDKAGRVGGCWQANTYPGVGVDIPMLTYSFSYAPPRRWSKLFANGNEVQQYAEQMVDQFGLRSKLRLGVEVEECRWDETEHLWMVQTAEGTITARHVILAYGAIEVPKLPDIDGLAEFSGKIVHTADWDHDFEYAGKRVGVIGTGASALQLIPEMAKVAGQLTVFQRTPIWVMPKLNFATDRGFKQALDVIPGLRWFLRAVGFFAMDFGLIGGVIHYGRFPYILDSMGSLLRFYYRTQVPDPWLRAKLIPEYTFFCKRPSASNTYLKTYTKKHVHLVTDPIHKVVGNRVITADGARHELEVLVAATGFKIGEHGASPPFPVTGCGGVELSEYWSKNRFQAYQGVSVPGFPNMFMMSGPYSIGSGSYISSLEDAAVHAVRVITAARHRAQTAAEIRQEPHDRYFQDCLRLSGGTVFRQGNCAGSNTYYINSDGDTPLLRPQVSAVVRRDNRTFPIDNYRFTAVST